MPMPVTVRVDKSVADTMDSQMQASFVNHIFNFFAPPASSQGADAAAAVGDSAPPVPPVPPGLAGGTPDLPVLLSVLKAAGFIVKFSDKSDFGGVSYGCRAIILCKRSGTRVVLDGEGPCTCPTEEEMKRILDTGSQAPSRAASPTPSQSGLLEETFRVTGKAEMGGTIEEEGGPGSSSGCSGSPPPAPGLTRQGTWSRDDDVRSVRRSLSTPDRRLSAPPAPAQSSWATITGDELNVMAATDLLQEAISLLSGIKKVSMRNTPVGPSRGAARRVSADTFLVPQRPVSSLSRSSSVTSGLASSRSSSSLSEPHSDTPRPLRPGAGTGTGTETRTRTPVRRAASATTSSTRAAAAAVKSRAEAGKKGSESSGTPRLGSKLPSFLKASSSGAKSSPRPPLRSGLIPPKIKTNASFTSAKLSEPKVSKSPEIESVQL